MATTGLSGPYNLTAEGVTASVKQKSPGAYALGKTVEEVFRALNGMLELSVSTFDRGSAYALQECLVTGWPGEQHALEIGLNSGFVLDFLKQAGDVPSTASFRDGQSAALFAIDGWQYVVMPVRI